MLANDKWLMSMQKSCRCLGSVPGLSWLLSWDSMWAIHKLTPEALVLQTCSLPSACKALLRHGVGEALPSLLQVGVLSMLLGNHGVNTVSIGTLFTRFLYDVGVAECVVRSSAAIAACQPKEQARARFLYDMGLARPCQTCSRWGC